LPLIAVATTLRRQLQHLPPLLTIEQTPRGDLVDMTPAANADALVIQRAD